MQTFTFALLTTFGLAARIINQDDTSVDMMPEIADTEAQVDVAAAAVEEEPQAFAFEIPDLANLGFIPTVSEQDDEPAVATANFEFNMPEIPSFEVPTIEQIQEAVEEPVEAVEAVEEPVEVVEEPQEVVEVPIEAIEAAMEAVKAQAEQEEAPEVEAPAPEVEAPAEDMEEPTAVEVVASPEVEAKIIAVAEEAATEVVQDIATDVATTVATSVAEDVAELVATEVANEVSDQAAEAAMPVPTAQEAAPAVQSANDPAAESTNAPAAESTEKTEEGAKDTATEIPVIPVPTEQEAAPKVESFSFINMDGSQAYPDIPPPLPGLGGPVSPFPYQEPIIEPEPVEEACRNCGEYGCDCDELRDRRGLLRDDLYGLREQERDAKNTVRAIRSQMREMRYERRDLGHTLMSRRGLKLRREMDERKQLLRGSDLGRDERSDLRRMNKRDKKSLRGSSRRRSELMARMRNFGGSRFGGFKGFGGGYQRY